MSPSYDGENVAEEIWAFLNQWNLKHKVMNSTIDNASNNDMMIIHLDEFKSTAGSDMRSSLVEESYHGVVRSKIV